LKREEGRGKREEGRGKKASPLPIPQSYTIKAAKSQ